MSKQQISIKNAVSIPEGMGVSCAGCAMSTALMDVATDYQAHDERLKIIRQCKNKKGRFLNFDVKHDDLIHRCEMFSPNDSEAIRFSPLQSDAVRQFLMQSAQTPGNDYLAAQAIAKKLYADGLSKKNHTNSRKEIAEMMKRTPVVGKMVEIIFDEKCALERLKNERRNRLVGGR